MAVAAFLLYPEALATSVTLPVEILHAAGQMSRSRGLRSRKTDVELCSLQDTHSITLESGLRIAVDKTLQELTACDLLILPAIWRHPRRVLKRLYRYLPIIAELHRAGTTICSVGSASSILAEAGLLDGVPATTHWHDFERFAASYPNVELKQRHLITQSGTLYCVGSVNSIADFMIHQLEQWYDAGIARAVEAQFSPEARQTFETAAFLQQSPTTHHDALVRAIQDLMQEDLAGEHSLASLSQLFGLSPRSLGRRFNQATGESPMSYLRQLRLREARALLQHSDLTIADIGWRCGYSSPSRFAQTFRESTGLSPRGYRKAVRGKRFGDVAAP